MTSDFIDSLLIKIFLECCLNFSSSKHHTGMEIKKHYQKWFFQIQTKKLLSGPEIDPEKLNYAASKSGVLRKLSLENRISFNFNETSVRYVTN